MAKGIGVVAVIVAYNPDLNKLGALIDCCSPQVDRVVVVDNSDNSCLSDSFAQRLGPQAALLRMGGNKGIAAAQNAGIAWAQAQNATYVILFDHDSEPPPDLVQHLYAAHKELEGAGRKVAAVGPRYVDTRNGKGRVPSPFSRFKFGFISQTHPSSASPFVPVDFLIASGSLIPVRTLGSVGTMNEALFIDYVDIEWGLRARQAGWDLFGVWSTVMEHGLGDARVVVLGRAFPAHSPLRHYYAIRNAFWLAFSPHSKLKARWRCGIAYNGFRRFIAYALFMPQPIIHVRFMCLGVWHAVRGRLGKL
jgi:rhamnosyltransferase